MTDELGLGNKSSSELKALVERIERLHGERQNIADDIKDVYAEAKSSGFNAKAIRHIVSERAKDQNAAQEFETIVDLYKSALGMA
jgi:uncharacterized protein (UPF0335 family)